MALHIRDNFQAGGPITQVPASWFNAVAGFINGLVAGPGIKPFEKSENGATIIELDNGNRGESPTDAGAFPTDQLDTPTEDTTLWTAGGADGANLMLLYKCENAEDEGVHEVHAARLELTSDGRISKIVAVAKSGIYIPA